MHSLQLVVFAPAHFHAALLQRTMLDCFDPHVHVYAPLDDDLLAYLGRIADFGRRPQNPTAWRLDIRACDDWLDRFDAEQPGNVVVLSGRNRRKIDLIERAVAAGKHVLADKPWIIEKDALPRLNAVLDAASRAGLLVCDVMTERHEIASILLRDLVNDADTFGEPEPGDPDRPGVAMRSVHFLKKQVAGAPLRRPGWFFDVTEQGEALADVGTHLVDQAAWMLAPDQAIDVDRDIRMIRASRWPTVLDRSQFAAITGSDRFPRELEPRVMGDRLECFCNTSVTYRLRGVCIRLDVEWQAEATDGGGDTHDALFRGSRSAVFIRQAPGARAELFVAPNGTDDGNVRSGLERRIAAWQGRYPGVRAAQAGDEFRIVIPEVHRTGHEDHFAEVAVQFARHLAAQETLPPWELSHLRAKYFVTTQGVTLSRQTSE
jgi:predicted dehydrogenase